MKNKIVTTTINSPLGSLLAGSTTKGICLLEFEDQQRASRQLNTVARILKAEVVEGSHEYLDALQQQLSDYFNSEQTTFSLPLDLAGTEFQVTVWNALMTIPYGTKRSYSEQAQFIEKPNAVRAVGKANGDNRISIVIPCHRVVGKSGKLTGYGGGLWRKKKLLEHESRHR